jgi:hypothetical protein
MKSFPNRVVTALAVASGIAFLPSRPDALADVANAAASTDGIEVHGAAEVLERFCARDSEGRLWLELPGGMRFELITSTQDPAIANPGDGAFHPFEENEVHAALEGVQYPLAAIRADVFILPYPRRGGLESAAGPGLIMLAPGVRRLSSAQQHAEFVHELGHVVQYALMPDSDEQRWNAYRSLRGIEDRTLYSASNVHANRPHEIFAEDFRALFGDQLARYSGIENPHLTPPTRVRGLARFLLELTGIWPAASRLAAYPNPTHGPLRFTRSGGDAVPLDVFDAAGRRVVTLEPMRTQGGVEWSWGGLDGSGRAVGKGVLFARVRGESEPAARVSVLR